MRNEPPVTDHVILVHGTFAEPKPGDPQWYERGSRANPTFATQLESALRKEGLRATVSSFSWAAPNVHRARVEAGSRLARRIEEIRSQQKCRVHLVAHSHGGNVVLSAIGPRQPDQVLGGGRVVFLGTPFFRRYWLPVGRLSSFLETLGYLLVGMAIVLAVAYAFTAGIWLLASMTPWIETFEPDPRNWPWWLAAVLAAPSLLVLINLLQAPDRWNTNVYLPRVNPAWQSTRAQTGSGAVDALVVSATFLDEALLGLSADPLARALLAPVLKEVLCPVPSMRIPEVDSVGSFEWNDLRITVMHGVHGLRRGLYILIWPLWWLLYWLFMRRMALNVAENVVLGLALGLPVRMLRRSLIRVSARLGEGQRFREHFWDVTEHLMNAPANQKDGSTARSDYRFLTDDPLLEGEIERRRQQQSPGQGSAKVEHGFLRIAEIDSAVRRLERRLERAGIRTDEREQERRVFKTMFVLEQRVQEIAGSISLNHSGYYSSGVFIDATARFLARGEVPHESERVTERFADRSSHLRPMETVLVLGTLLALALYHAAPFLMGWLSLAARYVPFIERLPEQIASIPGWCSWALAALAAFCSWKLGSFAWAAVLEETIHVLGLMARGTILAAIIGLISGFLLGPTIVAVMTIPWWLVVNLALALLGIGFSVEAEQRERRARQRSRPGR